MKYTPKEVLQYVRENDVKFVKLSFCDLFGRQKNVSVVAQQLTEIFENGHMFDASVVRGFGCVGDLLLFPDAKTLTVLPWRPQSGEVVSLLSYVKHPDGSFFAGDSLHILDNAKEKLRAHGLQCEIGTESDFYVFKLDSEGEPTDVPADQAGYFDVSPLDACENLRRDIILSLEDMGIVPTSSHHERGPGQNEIEFVPTEAANAARNFLYFKAAVRNISSLSGLHATFAPKPLRDSVGSGLRITLTVGSANGSPADPKTLDAFIEGVIAKTNELVLFLNSTRDSYELFGEMRAPAYGAENNRTSYISTVPLADGRRRIEFNMADCLISPYLVFGLLLEAGVYGIGAGLKMKGKQQFVSCDGLPHSLDEALAVAEASDWLRGILTDEILREYVRIKREGSDGRDSRFV